METIQEWAKRDKYSIILNLVLFLLPNFKDIIHFKSFSDMAFTPETLTGIATGILLVIMNLKVRKLEKMTTLFSKFFAIKVDTLNTPFKGSEDAEFKRKIAALTTDERRQLEDMGLL